MTPMPNADNTARRAAPSQEEKARLLIIDDHPIFREGLRQVLDAEPGLSVCGEAASAPEALAAAAALQPDLAIVDITLDHSNGIDLIKDLGLQCPTLPVLVLSNHDEALYAQRCLRAGARGYVMKHQSPEHLVSAVHAVLQGRFHLSGEILDRILTRLGPSPKAGTDDHTGRLSDRELQVFEFYGKGQTTRQIATALHLSVKTIESHRDRIRGKLGFADSAALVRAAVQWVESQGGL